MRIISGACRSRPLVAPRGKTTRPMTDRVRENLFNILGPDAAEGAVVLDLFCGSGALGLEALSRGAASCTFVERAREAARTVTLNAERLGLADRTRLFQRDALRPGEWICTTSGNGYTLIFVDPPYKIPADETGRRQLRHMARRLVELGCLAPDAFVVLRAQRGTDPDLPWDGFDRTDTRTYGTTTLHLMRRHEATHDAS